VSVNKSYPKNAINLGKKRS